jgi:hypothetical protein
MSCGSLHLLGNRISPEGGACFLVNLQCPLNCLGQLNSKLGVGPKIASFHGTQNPISFLQHMRGPPLESRLFNQLVPQNIFCNLHGTSLLEILQADPLFCSVFEPCQEMPGLRRLLWDSGAIGTGIKTSCHRQCSFIPLVVRDLSKRATELPSGSSLE